MLASTHVVALVGCVACFACQGGSDSQGRRGGGDGGAGVSTSPLPVDPSAPSAGSAQGAPGPPGFMDAAPAAGEPSAPVKPDEPELADPGRTIAELGAIPAWQAVVDRAELLGRRGQHGVVYGRVAAIASPTASDAGVTAAADAPGAGGSAATAVRLASPYAWLIDDTEGNGALGIRIALGDKARTGDRIAAGGAWQLDTERRWFWKPDTVQLLPPAPPGDVKDPPPAAPSHAIASGDLPSGARAISLARDNDAVYFQIVGQLPANDGDGWQVADQLGSPAAMVMILPGERASYGGQDMRAADERWQLKRGQTYWVRIGKLHKRAADKPTTVNARTAPVRVR